MKLLVEEMKKQVDCIYQMRTTALLSIDFRYGEPRIRQTETVRRDRKKKDLKPGY